LYYDLTVPIVKKNIDIVVFNTADIDINDVKQFNEFKNTASNYLVLGELKGGIDPAGADEHWKTANTALNRIREAFSKTNIPVFTLFIGAAIEAAMAEEIYQQCISGELSNCANLTKDNQLIAVCDWIICL
jgi:type II restriction enzyme